MERARLWLSIPEMIAIIDQLDGYGLVSTDDDALEERLTELGFNQSGPA